MLSKMRRKASNTWPSIRWKPICTKYLESKTTSWQRCSSLTSRSTLLIVTSLTSTSSLADLTSFGQRKRSSLIMKLPQHVSGASETLCKPGEKLWESSCTSFWGQVAARLSRYLTWSSFAVSLKKTAVISAQSAKSWCATIRSWILSPSMFTTESNSASSSTSSMFPIRA